jgi:hypothetical protein
MAKVARWGGKTYADGKHKIRGLTRSGSRKKLSAYQQFMKQELKTLKRTAPDLDHKERFALAVEHWNAGK